MKLSHLKVLFATVLSVSAASASAVGVYCSGGEFAVSLSDFNDISVSANGRLQAQGVATQQDRGGWQYLTVSRNVGPQPQDMFTSYTLVVPGVVGTAAFTGYLDVKLAGFGFPARVTRNPLYCNAQ